MRLLRLEAEGIFSFGVDVDRFVLDLDRDLTVVVGPNASGKSNVVRALKLVQTALLFQESNQDTRGALWAVLEDYARYARHEGMPSHDRSTLRVAVRLTGKAEVELLTSFVQATVVAALFSNKVVDSPSLPRIESWIAQYVTPDALSSLFEGTLVVSHSGILGAHWEVGYEFEHDDALLTWHINTETPNLTNVIAPRERTADDGLPNTVMLTQRLLGADNRDGTPVQPPEQPFSIAALLPINNEVVRLDMNPLNSNVAPAPFRSFVALAGIPVTSAEPLGPFRRAYTLASVWSRILDRGLWHLGVADGVLAPTLGGREVPTGEIDPHGDSADVYGRLHSLKNGDQAAQRRYRVIQELFERLAPGRRFEVRSDRQITTPDGPRTLVEIEVFPADVDPLAAEGRPLRLAGTGVEQALIIAEILVGDPDRVLLLDEPATNLHPPWQRIVRTHLAGRQGQCLLITHSPYLMPSDGREDLASIVRLVVRGRATRVHRLSNTDLADARWISTLVKELGWSADARGLLFAAGVVLTEGPTELAALPTWFARSKAAERYRTPDDLHVAFYTVGGEQSFRSFIALLERFGVPWAVICDGGAFRFDIRSHIFQQVLEAGTHDPELEKYVNHDLLRKVQSELDNGLFAAMVAVGQQHGIFTLAAGWQRKKEPGGDRESFEAFVKSQADLERAAEQAEAESPKSKPRAGRILADLTSCPPQVEELYPLILERLWSQGMHRLPDPPA